jgi:hypothetical protein
VGSQQALSAVVDSLLMVCWSLSILSFLERGAKGGDRQGSKQQDPFWNPDDEIGGGDFLLSRKHGLRFLKRAATAALKACLW